MQDVEDIEGLSSYDRSNKTPRAYGFLKMALEQGIACDAMLVTTQNITLHVNLSSKHISSFRADHNKVSPRLRISLHPWQGQSLPLNIKDSWGYPHIFDPP